MTTVICKMKTTYIDVPDYSSGTFTTLIKTQLETLEEATKRTIYEIELDKKCKAITDNYITYLDPEDYYSSGTFTSMIRMKTRLKPLEKENQEKECNIKCQNMENGCAEKV
jgi:hypothetical protein